MNKQDLKIIDNYIKAVSLIMKNEQISVFDIAAQKILYITPTMRYFLDYRKRNFKIENEHFWNLPKPIAELAQDFKDLLESVISTKTPTNALILHSFDESGNKEIKKIERIPILNQFDNQVIGVSDKITNFNFNENLKHLLHYLNKRFHPNGSFKLDNTQQPIKLSNRQHEILFLLMLGKTPRLIAEIINHMEGTTIKPSTVMSVINKQLYEKFQVYSMDQLVEKAVLIGFVNSIPKLFVNTPSGIILRTNI